MTQIALFSAKPYDRASFTDANGESGHEIRFLDARLDATTAELATGVPAVCAFVNDDLSAPVLGALARGGTRCLAMRCAGYNNVDLVAARELGLTVVRVPAYSPNAVAEHTLALILALNRNVHRAYNRVRDGNFSLVGLVGFDLAGRTAGVIGTGQIGAIVARLLWHFRCNVLAVDPNEDAHLIELGIEYVEFDELLERSDIVSLNCPLTASTHHLIDSSAIAHMRHGAMLVNTGRGPLIDTSAAIDGLKSGQLGSLALDVYEEEAPLFFEDRSQEILEDDVFARLLTFPNVLITAHQAFLTRDALAAIAATTLSNIETVTSGQDCANEIAG